MRDASRLLIAGGLAFAAEDHHFVVSMLCAVAHALNVGTVPDDDKAGHDRTVDE